MSTFKFLAKGARGVFSARVWPRSGEWITASGPLVLGSRGIHLCRAHDLAHWLHDELWETEHAGDELAADDCVVVARARLVRQIEGWNADGLRRFADACIARAAAALPAAGSEDARGFLDDARMANDHGYGAVAAFSAARAVAAVGLRSEAEHLVCYRAERAWQSSFIENQIVRL